MSNRKRVRDQMLDRRAEQAREVADSALWPGVYDELARQLERQLDAVDERILAERAATLPSQRNTAAAPVDHGLRTPPELVGPVSADMSFAAVRARMDADKADRRDSDRERRRRRRAKRRASK